MLKSPPSFEPGVEASRSVSSTMALVVRYALTSTDRSLRKISKETIFATFLLTGHSFIRLKCEEFRLFGRHSPLPLANALSARNSDSYEASLNEVYHA